MAPASPQKPEHFCATCGQGFCEESSLSAHQQVLHSNRKLVVVLPDFEIPDTVQWPPPSTAKREREALEAAGKLDATPVQNGTADSLVDQSEVEPQTPMPTSRRLKCRMCSVTFTDRLEWAQHLRQDHDGSPPLQTATKRKMSDEEGTPVKKVRRQWNSVGGSRFEDLDEESREKMVQCPECMLYYGDNRGLGAHMYHKHSVDKSARKTLLAAAGHKRKSTGVRAIPTFEKRAGPTVDHPHLEPEVRPPHDFESVSAAESEELPALTKEGPEAPPSEAEPRTDSHVGPTPLEVPEVEVEEPEVEPEAEPEPEEDLEPEESVSEVENYPCKYCDDRVFLTSYGLERHTKLSHPNYVFSVMQDIERLQNEPNIVGAASDQLIENLPVDGSLPGVGKRGRRGAGGRRPRGSHYTARSGGFTPPPDLSDSMGDFSTVSSGGRPELEPYIEIPQPDDLDFRREIKDAKTITVMPRTVLPSSDEASTPPESLTPTASLSMENDGDVFQLVRQHTAAVVAAASFTESRLTGRPRRTNDIAKAKYQSCEICGILINTEHPKAMESHTKAHQKNQELRQELLRMYGTVWVEKVTCRECNLVFKDEEKLDQHRRNVHVRRRHFLCRFCGDVFRNMRDLNLHKERRHEAFEGHRRAMDTMGITSVPQPIRHGASFSKRFPFESTGESGATAGGEEGFLCRANCETCGVQLMKISTLVRHMKTEHGVKNFTTTIEMHGYPSYKVDFFEGQYLFSCCDQIFDSRMSFQSHRRCLHGPANYSGRKECEYCGLFFRSNICYLNHLRTHREKHCTLCGERFGSTAADLDAFKLHMMTHRDHGYDIRLSQFSDLPDKEQELFQALIEEDSEENSDDDYSIFSESGVESEIEDEDENDDLLLTCLICEKRFSCVFRYRAHCNLHCRQIPLDNLNLKTKSYTSPDVQDLFRCYFCHKRFKHRESLAAHFINCMKRNHGFIQKEKYEESAVCLGNEAEKEEGGETPRQEQQAMVQEATEALPGADNLQNIPLPQNEGVMVEQNELAASSQPMPAGEAAAAEQVEQEALQGTSESAVSILEGGNIVEEISEKTLEGQLPVVSSSESAAVVPPTEPKRASKHMPNFVRKAYIVEWMLNKQPEDRPYVCRTCDEAFSDFLTLILHIKSHIIHVATPSSGGEEETSEETPELPLSPSKEQEMETERSEQKTQKSVEAVAEEATVVVPSEEQTVKLEVLTEADEKSTQSAEAQTEQDAEGEAGKTDEREELPRKNVLTVNILELVTGNEVRRGKFQCAVCYKRFQTGNDLKFHQSISHLPYKDYRCKVCRKRFWTLEGLNQHSDRHDPLKFYCSFCEKRFANADALAKHEVYHELSTSLYQCESCALSFYGLVQLRRHFKEQHEGVQIFICPVCARIHTDYSSLRKHIRNDHVGVTAACTICHRRFSCPLLARQHAHRMHMLRRSCEKCRFCQKVFYDKLSFIMHAWRHLTLNSFQCRLCDESFEAEAEATAHLVAVHPDVLATTGKGKKEAIEAGALFIVDTSDEGTARAEGAAATTDEGTAKPLFSCHLCCHTFAHKAEVRQHINEQHLAFSGFPCDQCGRTFINPDVLRTHLDLRHQQMAELEVEGEKPSEEGEQTEVHASPAESISDAVEAVAKEVIDSSIVSPVVAAVEGTAGAVASMLPSSDSAIIQIPAILTDSSAAAGAVILNSVSAGAQIMSYPTGGVVAVASQQQPYQVFVMENAEHSGAGEMAFPIDQQSQIQLVQLQQPAEAGASQVNDNEAMPMFQVEENHYKQFLNQ